MAWCGLRPPPRRGGLVSGGAAAADRPSGSSGRAQPHALAFKTTGKDFTQCESY